MLEFRMDTGLHIINLSEVVLFKNKIQIGKVVEIITTFPFLSIGVYLSSGFNDHCGGKLLRFVK